MKNSFFLKMLMLMFGIAAFGVVEGEGGGAAGEGSTGEGETSGDSEGETGKETTEPKGDDKEKPRGVSDSEAKLLRELMEKKTSLKDTKDQLAQVKEQLKQFDGINLDEVKALLKDRKESEERQLEAKGEWDRLKTNLVEQHQAEKTALEAQLADLRKELEARDGSINGLTIGSAFSASKFIADELTLTPSKAQIVYGSHFEYQDGKIVGYDKPKGAANRTQLIDATGEPLAFEAAIAKIVELDQDKEYLIRSKAKPGANSGAVDDAAARRPADNLSGLSRISAALATRK